MHAILPPPGRFHGHHAIVIGGSIAGLVAARVLAAHFDRVTVYDRDALTTEPVQRRGVPQGRHGHGLLASGLRGLQQLFPDLDRELIAAGAVPGDVVGNVRWFQHGHFKAQFTSGLDGILLSRPLLESCVRRRVQQLPNVSIVDNTRVAGLLSDRGTVHGVRVRRPGESESTVVADVVLDASGRGSHAPQWLEELGYAKPATDEVSVGIGYTTRVFRRLRGDLDGDRGIIIAPTPPREMRVGFLLAMEGDRWIATLGGWLGNHAPSELAAYLEFARSLPRPEIYDVLRHAEPLGDVATFGFPSSIRRRYEGLKRFPPGLLVLGDAICSVNPIYGHGMSLAVMQALALHDSLESATLLDRVWQPYFAAAANAVDGAWTIAAGADFAFRGVIGTRPAGVNAINRYMSFVHRAAALDRVVCRTFFDVANLLAPTSALLRPAMLARVARTCLLPAPVERRPAGRDTDHRHAMKTA
jgi:2-polyprenyl-6-methoxyphenol hydroxylase-like FAD-dependent oxidoreductase